MKAKEIRQMSEEDLNKKLVQLKQELFNLRFQLAINQIENPTRISVVKKDIARIKTVLREAELGEYEAPEKTVQPAEQADDTAAEQ
jgi:large subunit ribosomal protein L29